MVFVDTDVLSIFAKIQRLPLLFQVFNQESLNIARAVQNEIRRGILKGFQFSRDIIALQTQGRIQTHYPNATDLVFMRSLHESLEAGESESMALCKRFNAIFASNERRVMHHCRANEISCIDLARILRALWELEILTQTDVRCLMREIETADQLNFRTPNEIFR